jgi:VWFA-related protein
MYKRPQFLNNLISSKMNLIRVLTYHLSAAVIVMSLILPAWSQSSAHVSQESKTDDLVVKKTVRRVIVDVVVTDSNAKPVSGLTAKDFAVKEDDASQQILSFDAHSLDTAMDSVPKIPSLPPNTFLNLPPRPERGPLYIILYDMVNMEVEDQPRARQQMLKFIREKPAGTRFAIFVLTDRLRLVQGFTDDADQLYATLNPSSPKPHVPKIFLYGRNHGLGDQFFTLSVLTNIAHYLEGLPGHKNLLWFSSRFPVRLFPHEGDSDDMRQDTIEVVSAMTRSQIAVYTVDAGGLNPENPHGPQSMSDTGRIQITEGGAGASGGSGGEVDTGAGESLIMANQFVQRDIAAQTGGHAFVSTNDLVGAIIDATELGGNYYSLTYASTNQNYDGKLRKIDIEMAKHGYHLAYRRSYYADNPELPSSHIKTATSSEDEAPVRKKDDSLFANMQYGAPLAHQLLFKAHLYTVGSPVMGTDEQMANLAEQPAYFRIRHKNRPAKPIPPIQLQNYAIDYTIMARQVRAGNSNLEIAVAAFNGDGQMLNGVVENTPDIPANSSAKDFLRAQQHIAVPLNATSIRIAVHDLSSDRIGAMEVKLPLAPEASASVVAPEPKNLSATKPN